MSDNKTGRKVITVGQDGSRGVFQLCHKPETAVQVAEALRRKIAAARSKAQRPGSTLAQYARIASVEVE